MNNKIPFNPSHAILYEIYLRSFRDTNGDGNGDLPGVIEKLDYLQELGITAIWITPFYPSPMKDVGYDITDYCAVHPMFGVIEDIDILVNEAHNRGIAVIIDLVLNHTSDQHPWFLQSRSSKNNPKRDWYIWHDHKEGTVPNNWLSSFNGTVWEYDEKTKQYYLHTFLSQQPDLNWANPQVVEAMKQVMRFWLDHGIDGFRLDAIGHLWKQSHFRNEPQNPDYDSAKMEPHHQLLHIYTKDQDEMFTVLKELSDLMVSYGNKIFITESYPEKRGVDSIALYKEYYEKLPNNIVVPFNFEMIYLDWDAKKYKAFIDAYLLEFYGPRIPVFVLSNHDKKRLATRIGQANIKTAAVLLLTLPGFPVIYYGEEIGMRNRKIPLGQVQDPYEFRAPGFGRDPERTPMQWDSSENAGFTNGTPWLPLSEDYKIFNVQEEKKDEQSVFTLYKKLIDLRMNKYPVLLDGAYISIESGNDAVYSFIRKNEETTILVVLNFSNKSQHCAFQFAKAKVILSTAAERVAGEIIGDSTLTLFPHEASIFAMV